MMFEWHRVPKTFGHVRIGRWVLSWSRRHGATWWCRWGSVRIIQTHCHRQAKVRVGAFSFWWRDVS